MPIYLEGVYGLTASQSGLALIPLMVGTVMRRDLLRPPDGACAHTTSARR